MVNVLVKGILVAEIATFAYFPVLGLPGYLDVENALFDLKIAIAPAQSLKLTPIHLLLFITILYLDDVRGFFFDLDYSELNLSVVEILLLGLCGSDYFFYNTVCFRPSMIFWVVDQSFAPGR
jgi:hypothetical protein